MTPNRLSELAALGAAMRLRRAELGISQEELAHLAGLDRSYVGGVERGERNIAYINILKLAEALNMPAAALIGLAESQVS